MRIRVLVMMVFGLVFLLSATCIAAPAPVDDFGMTSSAHGKYVGQIVFSKSPIVFQKENETAFTDQFVYPDDKTYFMAYFPKSIANRCIEEHGARPGIANARITFSFFVNGEKTGEIEQHVNQSQLEKWTGWSDPQKPLGLTEGMLPKYCLLYRDTVLPKLKKGDNKVRMEVGYKVFADGAERVNQKPLTAGEFTVTMKKDWEKEYKEPPKAVMHDSKLEKKILDALSARWKKSEFLKVILTEKDWRVERNIAGVPERKVLRVYAISRLQSGECMVESFEVKRKYTGDGKYSDQILWYSSGGRAGYEVKCP